MTFKGYTTTSYQGKINSLDFEIKESFNDLRNGRK
jgi:hypothetical protein